MRRHFVLRTSFHLEPRIKANDGKENDTNHNDYANHHKNSGVYRFWIVNIRAIHVHNITIYQSFLSQKIETEASIIVILQKV